MWEHPTVEALARYLDGALVRRRRRAATVAARPRSPWGAHGARSRSPSSGCRRLPQASDLAALWRLLLNGIDAVSVVPPERGWDRSSLAATVDPDEWDKVRRGAFLPRIDQFDPLFFGLSPREAIAMDPQQRLMLELCWEALEDAGIPPGALRAAGRGCSRG